MKTYKIICTTDGSNSEKTIDSHLTLEDALAAIREEAKHIADRDDFLVEIPDEESARQWLAEEEEAAKVEDNEIHNIRIGWLNAIIRDGEYGIYNHQGPAVYIYGEHSFRYDTRYYAIEEDGGVILDNDTEEAILSHLHLMTAADGDPDCNIELGIADSTADPTAIFVPFRYHIGAGNFEDCACVYYPDSDQLFTPADWQGRCPESADDIDSVDWRDSEGHEAVVMDGLPRTFPA